MWEFNLVVTMASEGRFRQLVSDLEPYGEFHKTEFLGVLLGRVEDPAAFLQRVHSEKEKSVIAFQDLARVIPVERTFTFHLEEFLDRAQEAIRPYIALLAGRRFYVRLERRGMKGRLVSPEAERALDAFIAEELIRQGQSTQVDFEHPDAVVVLETIGDRCGVGLLSRELMERYDFVRVG
jgi:tRNA(Ser,Leu) C12 N-acetylase TAN1